MKTDEISHISVIPLVNGLKWVKLCDFNKYIRDEIHPCAASPQNRT